MSLVTVNNQMIVSNALNNARTVKSVVDYAAADVADLTQKLATVTILNGIKNIHWP
jgi:hypothetical protein